MNETYIIANRTDVGRAREHNEDNMVTFDSPNGRVIAVCDGMGGQAAGEVASRLACDIITDILTNNTFSNPIEAITRAIMAANQGILHCVSQNPEFEGMGTTCVMVILKDSKAYYGWVGDSRIYYISDNTITQVSRDQSYVQQLVDTGQITAAEAEHHPQKNEITNALGLSSMTPPEVCAIPINPSPSSMILLCSDGLSTMLEASSILSIVSQSHMTLQQKVDALVDQANDNGGTDNITVQLIQFGNATMAVTGQSDKSSGNDHKSKLILYISIIVGALIGAGGFFYTFMGKNESPKKSSSYIEDTRTKTKQGVKKSNATPSETVVKPSSPKKVKPVNTNTVNIKEPSKKPQQVNSKTVDKVNSNKNIKKEFGGINSDNSNNDGIDPGKVIKNTKEEKQSDALENIRESEPEIFN